LKINIFPSAAGGGVKLEGKAVRRDMAAVTKSKQWVIYCAKRLMIYAFWGWLGVTFMLSKTAAHDGGRSDIGTLLHL
jgi:hypothetical protein